MWRIASLQYKGSKINQEMYHYTHQSTIRLPISVDTLWLLCWHQFAYLLFVSFWTLELALITSLHMLIWKCEHELKRRLMSQDMKAQTPICSLPHSGALSPQNPILSVNAHTYLHHWLPTGRPRTQDSWCVCSYVSERLSEKERVCAWQKQRSKQREIAEGKETGILSGKCLHW